ncbi:MAG: hypothetical protein EZS28_004630 [Streblomastix strix]|uniref:Transmembrane protein n=1 Tax=Streblomastix strix TaxID=222440 RepID=A0A5J4WZR8_9EUKA|nr:MAG: hypothetical protein EZS28_004630 [Streblomastix strix]
MYQAILLVTIIIAHFILCANCNIITHVNWANDQGQNDNIQVNHIQGGMLYQSASLTFFSYENVSIIENMKFTEYSNVDNEKDLNFEIRQEFDSHQLNHDIIQENSTKQDIFELKGHHDKQYIQPNQGNSSNSLTILNNKLINEVGNAILIQFVNEVDISIINSALISQFKIIFIALLLRAIMIALLSLRNISQKYDPQLQKKETKQCNNLIFLLVIIIYHSIFEVAAETKYLSNQEFDGKGSQSIVVNQSTDEFKVTNCTFKNCGNNEIFGGALNIRLSNKGKCWILNSTFNNCNTTQDGGAIYANISSGAELTIDGLCLFTDCYSQDVPVLEEMEVESTLRLTLHKTVPFQSKILLFKDVEL